MPPSSYVSPTRTIALIARIRLCLAIVMAGLLLCGVATFVPLRVSHWLLNVAAPALALGPSTSAAGTAIPGSDLTGTAVYDYLLREHTARAAAYTLSPTLAYSTDWLAFALILFAILFLGPFRDPIRNQWVIRFGLIACLGIVPLAFIAGPLRSVPVLWRLLDCFIAALCAIPLMLCRHYLHLLEHLDRAAERQRSRRVDLRRHRLRRKEPKPLA